MDEREIDSTRRFRLSRSVRVIGLPSRRSTSKVERADAGIQSPSNVVKRLSLRFRFSSFLSGERKFGVAEKSDVRMLLPARFSSVMLGMCEKRLTFGASKLASCMCTTSNACRFARSLGVKRERSAPERLKARSLLAILAWPACHGTGLIDSTSAPEFGALWLVTIPVCGFTHCARSTRHCASVMSA